MPKRIGDPVRWYFGQFIALCAIGLVGITMNVVEAGIINFIAPYL